MKLHDLFRASAAVHPDKLAVVGYAGSLSFRQLEAEAVRLAAELRRRGAVPGDRVAMLMANSCEAAVTLWATLEAGCVIVPLHASARPDALQPVVRDADPHWLITGGELAATCSALLSASPFVRSSIVWGSQSQSGGLAESGAQAWRLCSPDDEAPVTNVSTEQPREDLAALIYTSGTTGEPKGAMLSHCNMVAALRAVNAYLHVESSDVIYSPLPLSSSYGIYQLVLGLATGATTLLDRSFAFPARSLELIARERATLIAGVPTMYAWMATSPVLGRFDLGSVRMLTSAAAALPVEHVRLLRERLPGARIYVMYGQTECKRITYLDPADLDRKPGSVGRGMPYQQHAVVDDSGVPVAPGETGELVVRGPHVMQGYWRNADATARKLRPIAGGPNPWLHTDDLFRVDEEGYLYFVGRRDDIIKVGGHKVSPREIEEVLCQMPDVREAAVVGMADSLWGQATKAYVVLRDGAECVPADVARFCKSRLRAYMVPKAIEFVRDLPKTESGKVKKRDLG